METCCNSEKFDTVAPRVPIVMKTTTDDFIFSTYDDCDIVIRRVGVNAGQIMDKSDLKEGFGSESCYWIKSKIDITQVTKEVRIHLISHPVSMILPIRNR